MKFNEDSRVKIPALLHLIHLGYQYIPLNEQNRIESNNIFSSIFIPKISALNGITEQEAQRILDEINLELDYEDLGKKFYKRLTSTSGVKLIDFENFNNNEFHVTTELTCKSGDEEFRPDITVLINGLPLAFIEVKKPHNQEGVIKERTRINERFKNKHFRRFANITSGGSTVQSTGILAEKFYGFMKPIQMKKEKNLKENQKLASLRDWLLPMLMNGQVSVGGYEVEDSELGMVADSVELYKKQ